MEVFAYVVNGHERRLPESGHAFNKHSFNYTPLLSAFGNFSKRFGAVSYCKFVSSCKFLGER